MILTLSNYQCQVVAIKHNTKREIKMNVSEENILEKHVERGERYAYCISLRQHHFTIKIFWIYHNISIQTHAEKLQLGSDFLPVHTNCSCSKKLVGW